MKLFYSPGACSLSPHIVLRELALPFELVRVDLKGDRKTPDGRDYAAINPKGYVPALELDDGTVLTEGAVIVQYLADLRPEAGLIPPAGSMGRIRVQEWLHFIGTELHRNFSPLFNKQASEDWRAASLERLRQRFAQLSDALAQDAYLGGARMCVADAYLFVMLQWARSLHFDLARWPNLEALHQRLLDRPAVREAVDAEGLRRNR